MSDLQETLEQRKQQLEARLNAIEKDLQKTYDPDSSEQSTERENDEVLESLAKTCAAEIQQINAVIKRIQEGLYGSCTSCGEDIAAQRLVAQPEALTCINCAS